MADTRTETTEPDPSATSVGNDETVNTQKPTEPDPSTASIGNDETVNPQKPTENKPSDSTSAETTVPTEELKDVIRDGKDEDSVVQPGADPITVTEGFSTSNSKGKHIAINIENS